MILAKLIAKLAISALLGWLIGLFIKAFPAPKFRMRMSWAAAHDRNNWIDRVAMLFCILGLLSPFALGMDAFKRYGAWPIGFQFGNMILFPAIWVCSFTLLSGGKRRLLEFGKFYEQKYGINMRGILTDYGLFGILGIVSIVAIASKGN